MPSRISLVVSVLVLLVTGLAGSLEAQNFADCVVSFRPGASASFTFPDLTLGAADQVAITLGDGGELVLGFGSEFEDGPGDDFVLHPRDETVDSCDVYLSSDGRTFTFAGTAAPTGNDPIGFDFGPSGLSRARFIRLLDPTGGTGDGYRVDAVQVNHPVAAGPGTGQLTGFVRFPDGQTPVPHVSVQLYSGPSLVACDNVDANGAYSLTAPPGSYQLVGVYPVPVRYVHRNMAAQVVHPVDNDTQADVVISGAGQTTPSVLDMTFHWPLLMLHGTLVPGHSLGPAQLAVLQPFLASNLSVALNTPRDAFIPIVPLLSADNRRTYNEFFQALVQQRNELLPILQPRFSLLGFSQGGLVARRVVSRVGGAGIEKVILMATANNGTCVADPALCTACAEVPYVCPLAPSVVAGFNQQYTSGFGLPFFLMAGSYGLDGCDCLAGVEADGFVPVDSVFYLDSNQFPGNNFDYNIVDKRVIGAAEVPPIGPHHYRLRREQVVFDILHQWLLQ